MSEIPLHLVTGFLGSGKTTFLKNYLDQFSGSRKIGIIQNEFSDSNIDGIELKQRDPGFELLEINNGSVFCVCLLGSFIDSLARFIEEVHPDEIILEASGMSDPLSIGQILQSPKLRLNVYLGQVWCLVDAVNFRKISALQTRVNHQIRIADVVIINKSDLVDSKNDELVQVIRKLNPFAAVVSTAFARVEFNQYEPVPKFFPANLQAENGRPDLESQVVKSNRLIAPEKLQEFAEMIQPGCLRSKGYVNLTTGKKVFLQGTFGLFEFHEADAFTSPTELVIIGNFPDNRSFQKLFDKLCI